MSGLDRSAEILAFLSKAAASAGVEVTVIQAEMTDFAAGPFDAAFYPLNSLGLLASEQALVAHLRSTAAAIEPDAPYVIDISTVEEAGANEVGDEWSMKRDGIEIRAALDGGAAKVFLIDAGLDEGLELGWGFDLSHSPGGFSSLVEQSAAFRVETIHPEDGHYVDGISRFAETSAADIPLGRSFPSCDGSDRSPTRSATRSAPARTLLARPGARLPGLAARALRSRPQGRRQTGSKVSGRAPG